VDAFFGGGQVGSRAIRMPRGSGVPVTTATGPLGAAGIGSDLPRRPHDWHGPWRWGPTGGMVEGPMHGGQVAVRREGQQASAEVCQMTGLRRLVCPIGPAGRARRCRWIEGGDGRQPIL